MVEHANWSPLDAAELAGIAKTHVRDPLYPGGRYCALCGPGNGRWPCDAVLLLAEVARLRAALETIRGSYGQVCAQYVECTHAACAASYGAWATADAALRPDA